MLSSGDDYPIHQLPEPIAYASGERNFYDRYFFNGYSRDFSLFFAAALGVYPQLGVMDAALSIVVDGVQRNLRASRSLDRARSHGDQGRSDRGRSGRAAALAARSRFEPASTASPPISSSPAARAPARNRASRAAPADGR